MNPVSQAVQWAAEIAALEQMFKIISDANMFLDPELQPTISRMSDRLKARRAELVALTSLYEGV